MSTEVDTRTDLARRVDDGDSDLDHIVCECDDDRALCGVDVSGYDWMDPRDEDFCVVCRDLEAQPCDRCGR